MKKDWQKEQGARCGCGGTDEYCGCQNNMPSDQPRLMPDEIFAWPSEVTPGGEMALTGSWSARRHYTDEAVKYYRSTEGEVEHLRALLAQHCAKTVDAEAFLRLASEAEIMRRTLRELCEEPGITVAEHAKQSDDLSPASLAIWAPETGETMTLIEYPWRPWRDLKRCPKCGSADLAVATSSLRREPTLRNPRPQTEWIGYDCRACGEQLRFDEGSQ